MYYTHERLYNSLMFLTFHHFLTSFPCFPSSERRWTSTTGLQGMSDSGESCVHDSWKIMCLTLFKPFWIETFILLILK